jgi:hypothetical protein
VTGLFTAMTVAICKPVPWYTAQNTQYTLILQADVDHKGLTIWLGPQQHSGTPVWQTPLFPPGSQPSRAVMEPNGDFVVYDTSNTALWSSDIAGHPGAYVVIEDGRLPGPTAANPTRVAKRHSLYYRIRLY